jgi:hypothetical protein
MAPILEEFDVGNLTAFVSYDTEPESPRHDGENLGTIWGWHRRYNLADANAGEPFSFTLDDFGRWDKLKEAMSKAYPGIVVLDVWLYDHSIQHISTTSFVGRAHHAEWDSGQYGVVYALPEQIRKWFGVKRVTERVREKARAVLASEITLFDQYISGAVYCVSIETKDGDEVASECGIYGLEEAREAAKELAESQTARAA